MQHLRSSICALLSIMISSFLYSQSSSNLPPTHVTNALHKQTKAAHCGNQAALLARDIQTGKSLSKLKNKYLLSDDGNTLFVSALVRVTSDFKKETFAKHNIAVNTALTDLYSIQIPIEDYQAFLDDPGIEYIELAKSISPKLDKALIAANVNAVHEGQDLPQGFSGKDVVVGIIDFGFDYTHPTFSDRQTGELRIKKVWEQNTLNSTPPSGFSYGRELSQEQTILNAQADLTISSHGTHVASIAAGNGGTLDDLYRGVAYESDIVLVQLNVRNGDNGKNTGVIDGINYIFQYAASVGKPAVINISQGHHFGPHDGTSLTDQAIDQMSGPGKIIVGAVGNEGDADGFYLHFNHTFDRENDILSYLVWPDEINAGATLVDMWGEAGEDFEVSLELYNPRTKRMEGSSDILDSKQPISFIDGTIIDREGDTLYYEAAIEVNPINNRPHAAMYINNTGQARGSDVNFDNLLDNDFVQLKFHGTKGTVHAYAANNAGEAFLTDLSGIGADEFINGIRIRGGNPSATMGELGGTAKSIISVGGYTTKNTFVNTSGQTLGLQTTIGAASSSSSKGPTLDGRTKPEISAPAGLISAAVSSFDVASDASLTTDKISNANGNDWYFGIKSGTSYAAPLVAGIVALMLEFDPNLTPAQVKEVLMAAAVKDNFTGQVPNQTWGAGKVDAHNAMTTISQVTATSPAILINRTNVFPNPNAGSFTIEDLTTGTTLIKILNAAGSLLFEKSYELTSDQLSIDLPSPIINGVYFLHVRQRDQEIQMKFIVLK